MIPAGLFCWGWLRLNANVLFDAAAEQSAIALAGNGPVNPTWRGTELDYLRPKKSQRPQDEGASCGPGSKLSAQSPVRGSRPFGKDPSR
jgi:hypothetical protein